MSERFLFGSEKPSSFWGALVGLIGHLAGTAALFVSLILFGWIISVVMHLLDTAQHFPPDILAAFAKFELYLTYFDMALCSLFLIAGARRFYKDLMEVL